MRKINVLDMQAVAFADEHITEISRKVEETVKACSDEIKNSSMPEMEFRNKVGSVHMKSMLFAALIILRGAKLTDDETLEFVMEAITILDVVDNMNRKNMH